MSDHSTSSADIQALSQHPEGFVKIDRGFRKWQWYEDANPLRLFLHCLIKANWKTKKWQGITIERGSFFTSVANLSSELSLTQKQIRIALSKLKRTNEIKVSPTNKGTLITVCEYDCYNGSSAEKSNETASLNTGKGQSDGKQRAIGWRSDGKQTATTREVVEQKEGKEAEEERSAREQIGRFQGEEETETLERPGIPDPLMKLSGMVAIPADEIRGIIEKNQIAEEVLTAWANDRQADGWRTRQRIPIGHANWFQDLQRFARHWSANEHGRQRGKGATSSAPVSPEDFSKIDGF